MSRRRQGKPGTPPPQGATRVQPEPPPRKRRPQRPLWLASVLALALGGSLILWLSGREPPEEPKKVAEQPVKEPRKAPEPRYDFYQELRKQGSGARLTPEQQAEADRARALLEQPPAAPALPEHPLVVPQPDPVADLTNAVAPATTVPAPENLDSLMRALQVPGQPGFILQAGSWSTAEGAAAARDQLAASGLPASVETGQVGTRTWYRVVVGPYENKQQADADSRRLQGAGFTPLLRRVSP